MKKIIKKIIGLVKRNPDKIIGVNYMHRWHIIPRNPIFNIYLHKYMGSDDDRALHDHPWLSVSVLLKGRIIEHQKNTTRSIPKYKPVFRTARFAHRLQLISGPAWTIFITGPRIRSWGFHCPNGWRHWTKFTNANGDNIGDGCD